MKTITLTKNEGRPLLDSEMNYYRGPVELAYKDIPKKMDPAEFLESMTRSINNLIIHAGTSVIDKNILLEALVGMANSFGSELRGEIRDRKKFLSAFRNVSAQYGFGVIGLYLMMNIHTHANIVCGGIDLIEHSCIEDGALSFAHPGSSGAIFNPVGESDYVNTASSIINTLPVKLAFQSAREILKTTTNKEDIKNIMSEMFVKTFANNKVFVDYGNIYEYIDSYFSMMRTAATSNLLTVYSYSKSCLEELLRLNVGKDAMSDYFKKYINSVVVDELIEGYSKDILHFIENSYSKEKLEELLNGLETIIEQSKATRIELKDQATVNPSFNPKATTSIKNLKEIAYPIIKSVNEVIFPNVKNDEREISTYELSLTAPINMLNACILEKDLTIEETLDMMERIILK